MKGMARLDATTVTQQLADAIAPGDKPDEHFARLCDSWTTAGAGFETVEPILRFMEDNASLDFGAPGPLVHFIERFHGEAYEALLLESVARRPTGHTVWMLNRVINGTKRPAARERLVRAMEQARTHPRADTGAVETATRCLERLPRE